MILRIVSQRAERCGHAAHPTASLGSLDEHSTTADAVLTLAPGAGGASIAIASASRCTGARTLPEEMAASDWIASDAAPPRDRSQQLPN
jgi:hypothetical protein